MEPAVVVRIHPGQWSFVLLLVTAWGVVPSHASSQARRDPGGRASSVVHQDSSELRNRARDAQRGFERLHRSHLYPTDEDWSGGGCDEQIGRICLRFQGGVDWEPVEEAPEVTEARDELLGTLAQVGEAIPGDHWVRGQRVRYLGDVGRWREAEEVARSCVAPPGWWCQALLGYVLHRGGMPAEAMVAFEAALDGMSPDRAREWTDPSVLVDYAVERWLSSPGQLTREEARERFWRLADPLYLTPGNERLTEHLARWFGSELYDDASTTMGLSWGRGFREILVRYGFVAGWEKTRPRMGDMATGSVVEHHHPDSRGLLPPFEALEDPSALEEGAWIPEDERPMSASAPVRAPLVARGRAQTAVLRRDGDLLVVAAYGAPMDTVLHRRRPDPAESNQEGSGDAGGEDERVRGQPPPWAPPATGLTSDTLSGLFLVPDTGAWAPWAALGRGAQGVLTLEVPPGGYLVSQELWNPSGRWGARVRHGVEAEAVPRDVPTLSDLILAGAVGGLPESLDEALPGMLSTTVLPAGETVRVVWEVYGLGRRREPLSFEISVVEAETGLIRRAFNRLGLFEKDPALTLSWTEGGDDALGPLLRAVDLDLPPLDSGQYLLRLELALPYRSKVLSERRITLY